MRDCIKTWVIALVVSGITIYLAATLSGCATTNKPRNQVVISTSTGNPL